MLISREGLRKLVDAELAAGTRVIAPVRERDRDLFRPLKSSAEMLDDRKSCATAMSLKEHLFPASECVVRYRLGPKGKVEMEQVDFSGVPRQLVVGSRPCDAAALPALDKLFNWDLEDGSWLARRAATTVVTVACSKAGPQCFCASVGRAPDSTDGSDLMLYPTEDGSLEAEAVTDRGKELVARHKALFIEAPAARRAVAEAKPGFESGAVKPWLDAHFEDPLWKEVSSACLGCGTCAFVCPVCHCFDIVDEGNRHGGNRVRNWDSCGNSLFTRHGSGHNPRASQEQRYRQRIMHKFKYFPEKFGVLACTGCGRCVVACPAGVDIREVLSRIAGMARPAGTGG